MAQTSVIIYGVGTMGQLIARLLLERGVRISGAIGRVSNIGRDLGEVIGWQEPLGVPIVADPAEVLGRVPADVAILSVGETMERAAPYLRRCIAAGVNVISLSEQVFYPWRCAPALAAEIDALAKERGVTVTAGGIQDLFWVNLVAVVSGASQTITAIDGVGCANADDYGPAVAQDNCIGESAEGFCVTCEDPTRANVFTIGLEALAAQLGFNVTGWEQGFRPLLAVVPVESSALGRTIEQGQVVGAVTWSRVDTEEGVPLTGEIHLKVFGEGDSETNRWVIHGEPELHVETPELPGRIATCTAVINRLPDVLAAEPGLVTVERLPKPRYRAKLC